MDFLTNEKLPQFVFALIVSIFYVPFLLFFAKAFRKKQARREFFQAVRSILGRVAENEEAAAQIAIIYKKIAGRYPHIPATYKNTVDFLEELFYRADSYGSDRFKWLYKVEFSDDDKKRVVNIINLIKVREPFASVSSKYVNLLNMASHALDTGNADLGKNSLRQLADDIEVLEDTISAQGRRNQISFIISVVGVILTLVFGALSLIPLIRDSLR
jgi:hypothetical protein